MPKKFQHVSCLRKSASILTDEGVEVEMYEFDFSVLSERDMRRWARLFRQHYCLDAHIDDLWEGTEFETKRDFLLGYVFPTTADFGPATRSGDFTEILMSDFLETQLNYWVPRARYLQKQIPNESPKGADIVGMKFYSSPMSPSINDSLMTFEVKASMSKKSGDNRLQDAIDDAKKDCRHDKVLGDAKGAFRVGLTLHALKRRYLESNDVQGRNAVQRFQDPIGRPYQHQIGASAVLCHSAYEEEVIKKASVASYPAGTAPVLIVVKGPEFMKFIRSFYERAADEAE